MPIFTTPDQFEDQTPSVGQRFGTALGTGMSEGLQMLMKQKVEGLEARNKASIGHDKEFGELPAAVSKFANDMKLEGYSADHYLNVLKLAQNLHDQGVSKNIAAEEAWLKFEEEKEEEEDKKPQTGLDYLKQRREGPQFTDLFKSKDGEPSTAEQFGKDIVHTRATEGSRAAYRRALEKIKTNNPVEDFSKGEISSLNNADIKRLPKEMQKKFFRKREAVDADMRLIAKLGLIPFVGGALEERIRENIDPDLPKPPHSIGIGRIAAEIPTLGPLLEGANLLMKTVKGATVFGGGAAVDEFIKTIGTDKPADLKSVGIQAGIGALFPIVGAAAKEMVKPFRNAIARRMQKGAINGIKATESLFEDATKSGVSIEGMQKGLEPERVKFVEFLEKDAKKTAEIVKPKPSKGIKKETLKLRAESSKEAEIRFAKEAETLSKTPIQKYMEPKKILQKGYIERQSKLGPILKNLEKEISVAEKNLLTSKGKELKNTQDSLSSLKERKYSLNHEIKYGKLRATASELTAQVEKSNSNLLDMIMNPTEDTYKAIQKNDKMMNTFLEREKNEVVKGRLPEKIATDTFLGIQDAHLKTYKDLQKTIKKQMLMPYSGVRESGLGQTILDQLSTRIKGLEAAQSVQTQKRKVLGALKGPTGRFYRNWVDKIKGEQSLLSKDMIRIGDKISKAERNITPIAKKRMEEAGATAVKKGEKEVVKVLKEAGLTKKESSESIKILKELMNPPKFKTFSESLKHRRKLVNKLIDPVRNQIIAGAIIGMIEGSVKETTGKKIPYQVKTVIYGLGGLAGKRGARKPFLVASNYITNELFNFTRKSIHKDILQSKKGIERRKEYERLKKKGFTSAELKEIRS